MPKFTCFVISVLGQDEFWNGGGTTSDINAATIYPTFQQAESDLPFASADLQAQWGMSGLEIRQMLRTTP